MKQGKRAVALLAGAVLLAGCRQQTAQNPAAVTANAETIAREVLEEVYSAGAQDSADFEEALAQSATTESALNDYLTGRVGDKVSDEGLAALVDNRVVTRVLNAWPSNEVTAQEVQLEPLDGTTDTACQYSYTVTAAPEGEDAQEFTGQIGLTLMDGVWMVTSVN